MPGASVMVVHGSNVETGTHKKGGMEDRGFSYVFPQMTRIGRYRPVYLTEESCDSARL